MARNRINRCRSRVKERGFPSSLFLYDREAKINNQEKLDGSRTVPTPKLSQRRFFVGRFVKRPLGLVHLRRQGLRHEAFIEDGKKGATLDSSGC